MDKTLMEKSSACSATSLAPGCCGILQLCKPGFVAVNTIQCDPAYVDRFRELFCSRAGAIDRMLGFLGMYVLEPSVEGGAYLVISHWVDEASFTAWTGSDEFLEGHRRAFQDLKEAKERGEAPPMTSDFKTYRLLTT